MKNRIEIVREMMAGMSKESKMFWLNVMVKRGELSPAEAGFILTY